MLDNPVIATLFILLLLVVGEIVSIKSRARIPMLAIALFGYLILIWIGVFPEDLLDKSTLAVFGSLMFAPLIVHMGTIIPFNMIKQQYKSVIISLIGIFIATITILLVVSPIFGYNVAVSSVGPISGGVVAFLITSEKLQEVGMAAIITVPAIIIGVQTLIGLPLSSFFLRKYAKKIISNKIELENTDEKQLTTQHEKSIQPEANDNKRSLIPEKYATAPILLLQLFIGGTIAVILDHFTGINYALWALAIGVIGTSVGFYQDNMLEKANSFGIVMVGIVFGVLGSMNGVTFDMVIEYFPAVMTILVIGAFGITIGGFIGSKLVKWDINKGIPVALTAMFGFPGDYLICEEISRSVGSTKEEQDYIFNEILSPMLVGGFTTVTVASVFVAGIVMNTL